MALDEWDGSRPSLFQVVGAGALLYAWGTLPHNRSSGKENGKARPSSTAADASSSSSPSQSIPASSPASMTLPPEFLAAVDVASIDCMMVSNPKSMIGLPYLTKHPDFRGRIFATKPTIRFAELFMSNYTYSPKTGKDGPGKRNGCSETDNNATCGTGGRLRAARRKRGRSTGNSPLFPATSWSVEQKDVEECLGKIACLSYRERVETREWCAVDAVIYPISSGYSVGSCNWVVELPPKEDGEPYRLGYMAASSHRGERHPSLMDYESLKGCDALVMTDIAELNYAQYGYRAPDDPIEQLKRLRREIESAMNRGLQVFIPVNPGGIVFDLLEYLPQEVRKRSSNRILGGGVSNANAGAMANFDLVSSNLMKSLQISTILPEWLNPKKQETAFNGQNPFGFIDSIERQHGQAPLSSGSKGALRLFDDPDLRRVSVKGDVVLFCPAGDLTDRNIHESIRVLGRDDSKSVVIRCEAPLSRPSPTSRRYLPKTLDIRDVVLDVKLRVSAIKRLLPKIAPRLLVVPKPLISVAEFKKDISKTGCPVLTFDVYDPAMVRVDFGQNVIAQVGKELHDALSAARGGKSTQGWKRARVARAQITAFEAVGAEIDGKLHLQQVSSYDKCAISSTFVEERSKLYGQFNPNIFLRELGLLGIYNVKTSPKKQAGKKAAELTITLPSLDAIVSVGGEDGEKISVVTNNKMSRRIIHKALTACFLSF